MTGEATFATHSFTGLVYDTMYYVSVMAVDAEGQEVIDTETITTAPGLLIAYNDGYTANATGSFTIPAGKSSITVFGCGGGGGSGYGSLLAYINYSQGADGGGAAHLAGYSIAVTAGQTYSYSIGCGGKAAIVDNTSGAAGGNTSLSLNDGGVVFQMNGGAGGASGQGGSAGGAGGTVVVGTGGVAGGAGGAGGVRDVSNGANGAGATNACGGGGGGGSHVTFKTGGAGGASTITASTFTAAAGYTVSFAGSTGGAAGTPASGTNAKPAALLGAIGGYGSEYTLDTNTGAGGGAGAGVVPVLSFLTSPTRLYGGGGGGNRTYIVGPTYSTVDAASVPDGSGGGGFLIVV